MVLAIKTKLFVITRMKTWEQRKKNRERLHFQQNSSCPPNGAGLRGTKEAVDPEANNTLPTPTPPNLIVGTCLLAWPPTRKHMAPAKGSGRNDLKEVSGTALSWSHILKAFVAEHKTAQERLFLCSNSLISNCGCMASLCSTQECWSAKFTVSNLLLNKTFSRAGFPRVLYGAPTTGAA